MFPIAYLGICLWNPIRQSLFWMHRNVTFGTIDRRFTTASWISAARLACQFHTVLKVFNHVKTNLIGKNWHHFSALWFYCYFFTFILTWNVVLSNLLTNFCTNRTAGPVQLELQQVQLITVGNVACFLHLTIACKFIQVWCQRQWTLWWHIFLSSHFIMQSLSSLLMENLRISSLYQEEVLRLPYHCDLPWLVVFCLRRYSASLIPVN